MMTKFYFQPILLILILLVTVSCEEKKDPTAPTIVLPGKQYKLAIYTDMLKASGNGFSIGKKKDEKLNYPLMLRNRLLADGLNVDVRIFGQDGRHLNDNIHFLHDIKEYKPHVVLIALGLKDGLRARDFKELRNQLDQVIRSFIEQRTNIIFAGLRIPLEKKRNRPRKNDINKKPRHQQFSEIYSEIANRYEITFIPYLYEDIANKRILIDKENMYLTEKGQDVLTKNIYEVVKAEVKQAIQKEKEREEYYKKLKEQESQQN